MTYAAPWKGMNGCSATVQWFELIHWVQLHCINWCALSHFCTKIGFSTVPPDSNPPEGCPQNHRRRQLRPPRPKAAGRRNGMAPKPSSINQFLNPYGLQVSVKKPPTQDLQTKKQSCHPHNFGRPFARLQECVRIFYESLESSKGNMEKKLNIFASQSRSKSDKGSRVFAALSSK